MKQLITLILIFILALSASGKEKVAKGNEAGGVFIRYNLYGYSPARNKKVVIMSERNITGQKWTLTNKTTGIVTESGAFENSVSGKSDHLPLDFNYILDFTTVKAEGDYEFATAGAQPALFPIKKNPYKDLVKAPLHWMRVARCGSADAIDHGVCHLGDKSCEVHHRKGFDNGSWHNDGNGKRINGVGGWHDAADYLKFSLTIGYSAYYILRSYEINPELFDDMKEYSKTQYNDLLDEAKWGLDFLARCMPDTDTNEFIIMVANSEDHNVGYRLPENDELDGKRPILSALSAPQMGYAAASLALGAQIFKKHDPKLAAYWESKARLIYRRATSKDVTPPAALNDEVNVFYGDETVNDNLSLAAGELFKLTGEAKYKADAIKYSDLCRAAGWKAWESVNLAAHMNIMDTYPVAKNYIFQDLDGFNENSRRQGNIWGIPMKYVWGGLYSYIGVGAAAMEYEIRTKDRRYRGLASSMTDYLLGGNNWGISFVAIPDGKNTISNPYSQVYNLQADKFPLGAISEGPGDRQSWEKFKHYFGFDVTAERTHKFNTRAGVFYDHRKDFMCMETTIAGMSDGIFMLAVASKMFAE